MSLPGLIELPDLPADETARYETLGNEMVSRLDVIDRAIDESANYYLRGAKSRIKRLNGMIGYGMDSDAVAGVESDGEVGDISRRPCVIGDPTCPMPSPFPGPLPGPLPGPEPSPLPGPEPEPGPTPGPTPAPSPGPTIETLLQCLCNAMQQIADALSCTGGNGVKPTPPSLHDPGGDGMVKGPSGGSANGGSCRPGEPVVGGKCDGWICCDVGDPRGYWAINPETGYCEPCYSAGNGHGGNGTNGDGHGGNLCDALTTIAQCMCCQAGISLGGAGNGGGEEPPLSPGLGGDGTGPPPSSGNGRGGRQIVCPPPKPPPPCTPADTTCPPCCPPGKEPRWDESAKKWVCEDIPDKGKPGPPPPPPGQLTPLCPL